MNKGPRSPSRNPLKVRTPKPKTELLFSKYPPGEFWGHAPGEQGYTYEVWNQFPYHRPQLAQHFTKHRGHQILPGDVVFWPQGSKSYPNSHVVVALSDTSRVDGTILCVTQNPGPVQITRLYVGEAAGFLRPKAKWITQQELPPPIPVPPVPVPPKKKKVFTMNYYRPATGKQQYLRPEKDWEAVVINDKGWITVHNGPGDIDNAALGLNVTGPIGAIVEVGWRIDDVEDSTGNTLSSRFILTDTFLVHEGETKRSVASPIQITASGKKGVSRRLRIYAKANKSGVKIVQVRYNMKEEK